MVFVFLFLTYFTLYDRLYVSSFLSYFPSRCFYAWCSEWLLFSGFPIEFLILLTIILSLRVCLYQMLLSLSKIFLFCRYINILNMNILEIKIFFWGDENVLHLHGWLYSYINRSQWAIHYDLCILLSVNFALKMTLLSLEEWEQK